MIHNDTMYYIPHIVFAVVVCLNVLVVQGLRHTAPHNVEDVQSLEDSDNKEYCPSFCDNSGNYHIGKFCPFIAPYCCQVKDQLSCCTNITLQVHDGIRDDHNCYNDRLEWLAHYWRVVLGVCLPVGVISVVVAVSLCSLQHVRQRRSRHAARDRDRCNSAMSTISGSSGSSGRSGVSTGPVVVTTDDTEQGAIFTIGPIQHPIEPPPYTANKPPEYEEIFPGDCFGLPDDVVPPYAFGKNQPTNCSPVVP